MIELNFSTYKFKIQPDVSRPKIFDEIRKKYVILTNEEWVRQHCVHYLLKEKNCPSSLIAIEASLKFNTLSKRADVMVFDRKGSPWLVVECKAPEIEISRDVFNQVACYNFIFHACYLMLTNGLQHYFCSYNHQENTYAFIQELPVFE